MRPGEHERESWAGLGYSPYTLIADGIRGSDEASLTCQVIFGHSNAFSLAVILVQLIESGTSNTVFILLSWYDTVPTYLITSVSLYPRHGACQKRLRCAMQKYEWKGCRCTCNHPIIHSGQPCRYEMKTSELTDTKWPFPTVILSRGKAVISVWLTVVCAWFP